MKGLLKMAPLLALLVLVGVVVAWLTASPGGPVEEPWGETRRSASTPRSVGRRAGPRRAGGRAGAAKETERPVGRVRFEGRLIRGVPPQETRPLRRVPLQVIERQEIEPEPGGRAEPSPVVRFEGYTDRDGRFTLPADGLHGEWVLTIGEHPRMPRGVVLAEGRGPVRGAWRLGELLIGPPHGVRARLVDGKSGEPLRDAGMALQIQAFPPNGTAARFGLLGEPGDHLVHARADAEGVVEVLRLPIRAATVELFAGGRLNEQRLVAMPPGGVQDLGDRALERAPSLDGRVVDGAGAPVVGARVQAPAAGASSWVGTQAQVVTDADGRFHFDSVGLQELHLLVESDAHPEAILPVEAGGEPVEVRVRPARWIGGRVEGLPDGVPVDAVRIEVRRHGSTRRRVASRAPRCAGDAVVEVDGSFRVAAFVPDDLLLRADAGEHGRSGWRQAEQGVEQPVVLRLGEERREMVVSVVDPRGVAVAGATVGWDNAPDALWGIPRGGLLQPRAIARDREPEEELPRAETDARGVVRFGIDAAAALAVRVYGATGLVVERGFPRGEVPDRIDFALPSAGTVTGSVAGREAWSGERFRVEAWSLERGLRMAPVATSEVHADGFFDLGKLAVGSYALDLRAVGAWQRDEAAVQPAPGSRAARCALRSRCPGGGDRRPRACRGARVARTGRRRGAHHPRWAAVGAHAGLGAAEGGRSAGSWRRGQAAWKTAGRALRVERPRGPLPLPGGGGWQVAAVGAAGPGA